VAQGVVHEWTDTFHVADPGGIIGTRTGPMRYAAPLGLRAVVECLVDGLVVESNHTVTTVDHRPSVDGVDARAVALCMPGPQAARLLPDDSALLAPALARTWEPVLSLTAVYDERVWSAEIDGVFVNDDPILTWVADDGRRRGDDAPVLVAHADPVLSARHRDDPASAAPLMLAALRRVLSLDVDPSWVEVKRWGLARPIGAAEEPFAYADGVGLAGDAWAGGPRIEAAWLSGKALGRHLVGLG
jgi:predicted NAD/FAD-dependent oxidoreductase